MQLAGRAQHSPGWRRDVGWAGALGGGGGSLYQAECDLKGVWGGLTTGEGPGLTWPSRSGAVKKMPHGAVDVSAAGLCNPASLPSPGRSPLGAIILKLWCRSGSTRPLQQSLDLGRMRKTPQVLNSARHPHLEITPLLPSGCSGLYSYEGPLNVFVSQ